MCRSLCRLSRDGRDAMCFSHIDHVSAVGGKTLSFNLGPHLPVMCATGILFFFFKGVG